jgi:rRNA-processing protein FCF1
LEDNVRDVGKIPVVILTNKLVIELSDIRERLGKSWVNLLTWLHFLSNKYGLATTYCVHIAIERIIDHKHELINLKKKKGGEEFFLGKEVFIATNEKQRTSTG